MNIIKFILKAVHITNVKILSLVSPVLSLKYNYLIITRKKLNLKNPKDFNEKIQWIKLNYRNDLIVKCTDKYEVREYVSQHINSKVLNKLYDVYNSVNEINWSELPEKFALKTTHGCGGNIICDSKKNLDINDAIEKLNVWMNTDYTKISGEWQYRKITPRIICEKFLDDGYGQLPRDYKIYCFNGEPKVVLLISGRGSNLKLDFMDLNWERLNLSKSIFVSENLPERPKNLELIIEYARKLAQPFPFVRADFYSINKKPIFGELTFSPAAGFATYYTDYGLNYLGDLFNIENK